MAMPRKAPLNMTNMHRTFHTILVLWCWSPKPTQAWNLPLLGGGKVSYQDGVLRIVSGPRANDCPMPDPNAVIAPSILDCIEVRDTGIPQKGFGAFCVQQAIPKHAFLGFYPGKLITRDLNDDIDQPFLDNNEQGNRGDYILSLDGGLTFLDGYERAQDRSVFAPVHLNHKDKDDPGCNCYRRQLNDAKQVAFFTRREVQVEEELCFDYGSNYWRGRENDKV